MQLAQVGRSSPHLIRRLRQVKQPVLVLLRILVVAAGPEPLPVGERSPPPPPLGGEMDRAVAIWTSCGCDDHKAVGW